MDAARLPPPALPGNPADVPGLGRRLQQTERLLACFRRTAGHDLPNQLVGLQGLLRVLELEEGDRLSADGRAYLQRVAAAAQRAHETVRALAVLARIGWESRAPELLDLPLAAREAAAEVKQAFPARPVEFDFDFVQPAPALHLPRRELHLVLVQLLRNAVQAVEDGQTARVQVGLRAALAGVQLWVADNGRGVPAVRLPPLEQFCAGCLDDLPGSGLGLFLVRQFVDAWGGSLSVASDPACGTVFTVALPSSTGAVLG